VIANSDFERLLERLRGLCQPKETYFKIHEILYKIEGNPPSELRVRCTFSHEKGSTENTKCWTLHYIGTPPKRADLACLCKNVIDVEVSDNICNFLEMMGYTLIFCFRLVDDFEFVREGVRLHALLTDHIKADITVSKVKRLVVKGQLESAIEVEATAHHWLVEISAHSHEEAIKQTCDALNNFANRLMPIVDMIKLDNNTKKEIEKLHQQRKIAQTSGTNT